MFDRAIDSDVSKLDRQRRRCGREGCAQGRGGQADGAKIVGPVVCRMVLGPIAVGRSARGGQRSGTTLRTSPVKGVNVTEGHGKIDGDRDQREP